VAALKDAERIRKYFGRARWRPSAGREYLGRERQLLLNMAVATLSKPLDTIGLCDVGCGSGQDLIAWRNAGVPESRLAGTELIQERAKAAQRALPRANIRTVSGSELPFGSASFDVCSASLVLSTILSRSHQARLLSEMKRVTAPGGLVIVYDFMLKKPWNRNVKRVSRTHLGEFWRPPDMEVRAAPFLPLLDIAERMPPRFAKGIVDLLPRTHRLWAWRVEPRH
jgi:SAM-dependent methyltransferase